MVNIRKAPQDNFPPLLHLTYDLQQLSDRILGPRAGIGLGQARIMSGLHTAIPRSQRELASALHQTEANISRQLKLMHAQKLVSITRNKKDGRQRDVKLTAKGAKTYKLALKSLAMQQNELMKLVDQKERKAFEQVSSHLISALGVKDSKRRKFLG